MQSTPATTRNVTPGAASDGEQRGQPGTPPVSDPASTDTVDGEPRTRTRKLRERVGRYIILGSLGEGGMGVVYEAYDPELNRRVAIKLLHPGRAGSTAQQRLLREAQAMAMLSHPNVVQIYDAGIVRDQVFLALELIRGQTVRDWLEKRRRPWADVLAPFIEAGRGLEAAHAAGIVHRDFKPSNILLAEDGRVAVADFGVASLQALDDKRAPTGREGGPPNVSLTNTGAVIGTPVYMAPEQHAGKRVGPAADQFSFCVALHEGLYGQRPFAGKSHAELATGVLEGRYVPPTDGSGVPRWLARLVRRGLSIDPGDRHPSMTALLAQLADDPAIARRRWAGIAAITAAVSVASWAVMSRPADKACDGGTGKMEQLWSDAQRSETQAAFERAAHLDGSALSDWSATVTEQLDRYSTRWADAHDQMCVAHRDGELSSPMFDAAMACLERRRGAVEAFIDGVGSGETSVLARATEAVSRLDGIDGCTRADVLAVDIALPDDPAAATEVTTLRERIAKAEVLHDLGSVEAGKAELEAIRTRADALDHPPLLAELGLVAGRLAINRNDVSAAREQLTLALHTGLASGADAVAAEAITRRVFTLAMADDAPNAITSDHELARALLQRVGDPPALAALLANNVGVSYAVRGEPAEAARWFDDALTFADQASELNPVDLAGYLTNRAVTVTDPEQRDALFGRAHEIISEALGEGHLEQVELAWRRAEYSADPQTRIERLGPACLALRQRHRDDQEACQLCYQHLAEVHDALGQREQAIAAVDRALRCVAVQSIERGSPVDARHQQLQGHQAVLEGVPPDALTALARAREILEPHRQLSWIGYELATIALLEARALDAQGRGSSAIASLREAVTVLEAYGRRNENPMPRARAQQARALLAELMREQPSSNAEVPGSGSGRTAVVDPSPGHDLGTR
ncbi:MAG: protein kinase [Deltaproteobacteria bacterium]|nr:protein kinase [Deltaproteobacteria bacterium]